jgi:hypothetical protein
MKNSIILVVAIILVGCATDTNHQWARALREHDRQEAAASPEEKARVKRVQANFDRLFYDKNGDHAAAAMRVWEAQQQARREAMVDVIKDAIIKAKAEEGATQ